MIPCILHEDDHLLVIDKPAGMSTHSPSLFAGEGIYEWLKHREPRWAHLAIIHRLDKETSGVMIFGKTKLANQSLTQQFTDRQVRKTYCLLTDRPVTRKTLVAKSRIVRRGERYESGSNGEPAETRFTRLDSAARIPNAVLMRAEPLTGRTHQIRVQAAEAGFPVLGDSLYGGTPFQRLCLHSSEISFVHPEAGKEVSFKALLEFDENSRLALRHALIDPSETNAYRLLHGGSDGCPGEYVDRLGEFLLSQGELPLDEAKVEKLEELMERVGGAGAYHKILRRKIRTTKPDEAAAVAVLGRPAPERFVIREHGVEYELGFREGYSVGLFIDQRDNRRRLRFGHVAADFKLPSSEIRSVKPELLNTFAYTCSYSVCAAKAGIRTSSLDLSKKYLEWGRRNFELNGIDPGEHDFIYGDTFDWLKRFKKKGRFFDIILLDPPTFSQSKASGVFQSGKHYGRLVAAALPVLKGGGVLFASTNNAQVSPERFLKMIESAVRSGRREILQRHYVPQPPDFPISRSEPAYLKTVWLRVS